MDPWFLDAELAPLLFDKVPTPTQNRCRCIRRCWAISGLRTFRLALCSWLSFNMFIFARPLPRSRVTLTSKIVSLGHVQLPMFTLRSLCI